MNAEKYFILHDANWAFALTQIQVSDSSIDGNLDSLLTAHEEHLHPAKARHNRYPSYNKDFVLNEVHIYIKSPVNYVSRVQIPIRNISRVDVYALDKGSTTLNTIGSIIGITAATALVTIIIVYAANPLWKK